MTPTGTASSGSVAPAAKAVVYVGRTAGREATVAVAVKGQRAVAYVCDGVRLEAWLSGGVTGGPLKLQSKTGERLTGTVSVRNVVGELTLQGRTLRFSATPAGRPAGLYRAKNSKSTIGWIVLPNGDQVGIDNDGTPAAAPRLDPASGGATVGGVKVTAQPVAGDESLS